MIRIKMGEEVMRSNIRARVRFDYIGLNKTSHFFFGNKPTEKIAIENRQQQATQLRNIPLPDIYIEELNTDFPIYTMYHEYTGETLAYAPLEVIVSAPTIEDIMCFILREEFRRVEILEPDQICISRVDVERFFFRMNETMRNLTDSLLKKASGR
jgi:hypothetical protein